MSESETQQPVTVDGEPESSSRRALVKKAAYSAPVLALLAIAGRSAPGMAQDDIQGPPCQPGVDPLDPTCSI